MLILIDNYDSFTYNLRHYLGELGAEVDVYRNDALTVSEVMALKPEGLVISPGPCDPDRAGICLELIEKAHRDIPIFGVCLGHQCIGQVFGGTVDRAPKPMHGKVSQIHHDGTGVLKGIANPFTATRYHSLMVNRKDFPDDLMITANSNDDVIQGLQHRELPIFGAQFHPESIASENGHQILKTFIEIAGDGRKQAA